MTLHQVQLTLSELDESLRALHFSREWWQVRQSSLESLAPTLQDLEGGFRSELTKLDPSAQLDHKAELRFLKAERAVHAVCLCLRSTTVSQLLPRT